MPPARERLVESRTIKGGGVASVAIVGAAGVEVAQEALAETQEAVLPLVPYLDSLRWVFIAAALAGIAVAMYARIDDWKAGRVIAALAAGLIPRPWARTALRWGAVGLAVLLFLLCLRCAGERAGANGGASRDHGGVR